MVTIALTVFIKQIMETANNNNKVFFCRHAYPAWWLTEPASAFPEPQGRMPTGTFIACSQSGRSISPLITYRNINI